MTFRSDLVLESLFALGLAFECPRCMGAGYFFKGVYGSSTMEYHIVGELPKDRSNFPVGSGSDVFHARATECYNCSGAGLIADDDKWRGYAASLQMKLIENDVITDCNNGR